MVPQVNGPWPPSASEARRALARKGRLQHDDEGDRPRGGAGLFALLQVAALWLAFTWQVPPWPTRPASPRIRMP